MKEDNIVLVGLMGCGKTTIGRAYSDKFKLNFLDLDEFIEKRENKKISDIFSEFGEPYFRELEHKAILDISNFKNTVISTGGGVLENEDNLINLKNIGTVIYLRTSVDVLYRRVKNDDKRPLLRCENPREKLRELLEKREENYSKADIIIDVNKSVDDIIEEINEKIKG